MRLHQVTRAEATSPVVTMMYDYLFGDRCPVAEPGTSTGTQGDWWTVFANSPDVLEHAVQGFVLYQSPKRELDPVLRELAQTRVGWARASQFVFSQHCKSCRDVGISEERIAAIPSWSVASCFSDVERAVLAYTDALVLGGGRVSDGTFDALHSLLSDEEILELTYITCLYDMHDGVFVRSVYFQDPDGVLLELAAWTKVFSDEDVRHQPARALSSVEG
jgi:alkylhydroperoxidase family enzyme